MSKTTRTPLPRMVLTRDEFASIKEHRRQFVQFVPGRGWISKYKDYNHYLCMMRADHRSGAVNAPGWFRRMYNRFSRRQQERALRKAMLEDLDNFALPMRKRNIDWEWF